MFECRLTWHGHLTPAMASDIQILVDNLKKLCYTMYILLVSIKMLKFKISPNRDNAPLHVSKLSRLSMKSLFVSQNSFNRRCQSVKISCTCSILHVNSYQRPERPQRRQA